MTVLGDSRPERFSPKRVVALVLRTVFQITYPWLDLPTVEWLGQGLLITVDKIRFLYKKDVIAVGIL